MSDENIASLGNNLFHWMTAQSSRHPSTTHKSNNNNNSHIQDSARKSPTVPVSSYNDNNKTSNDDKNNSSGGSQQSMAAVPEVAWNNTTSAAVTATAGSSSALLDFAMNGTDNKPQSGGPSGPAGASGGTTANATANGAENDSWTRGGRQFASSREVYTRSLFRICLKFTTSEDEDEGKPEPATAFWTLYGKQTTIGNGAPSSHSPDDICRRMDDSMTGPSAGILARLTDFDGDQAAGYALRSGMTTGWHIRGDRGDAAVRVGKAKVFSGKNGPDGPTREAQMLSLDADRWVLCKGASFAAGNSVFNVEDVSEAKQKITVHCSKGPMRGKLIDIHAARCPFVFGRAHEADLCIMDRELSRRHGAVLYIPGRKTASGRGKTTNTSGTFVLVDLESTVSCSSSFHVSITLF
jgi:hypothetical protein